MLDGLWFDFIKKYWVRILLALTGVALIAAAIPVCIILMIYGSMFH